MKLTEAQQAAVSHRDGHALVSASAGSGKTHVLSMRCAALVSDPEHPCDIDQLLVVTFTRAAAAELRVRVARRLRDAAAEVSSRSLRRHLHRQQALVDVADIGTIDAWCGRIVREHFVQAGVDPAYTVLSGADAQLLRTQVLDQVMKDIYAGRSVVADAAQPWLLRAASPGEGFLRTLITRLNTFREHLVNPKPWLRREAERLATDDAAAVLAAALQGECRFQRDQLIALLAEASAEDAAILKPYGAALDEWIAALDTPTSVTEVVAGIKKARIRVARGQSPSVLVSEIKERWLTKRLKKRWDSDHVASILDGVPQAADLMGRLLQIEQHYDECLRVEKRRRRQLEFADVLRHTLDLLGTPAGDTRAPTELARRLRARYAHVLVDEYQDTSPVQVEVLRLVSREGGAANRFMVGDVKQSIYGFRQADPRLFMVQSDALNEDAEPGCVVRLSDNFRSHADLLRPLNEIFANLFDRALGGTPYGEEERLRAGRDVKEIGNPTLDATPRVVVDVLEAERGRSTSDDAEDAGDELERIEREAVIAAGEIRDLLDAGTMVPERQADDTTRLRPLCRRDIVILLRSAKQNAGRIAGVLRRCGVPCATGGRESLLDSVEVRDIQSALQLIVNRRQDVPLAAYLHSPLMPAEAGGPLSPAELRDVVAVRRERGAELFDVVEVYCRENSEHALAARIRAGLAQIDDWATVAREQDVVGLLRRILHDTGLPAFASALPGGPQRVAILRSLQDFAADFTAHDGRGVDAFLDYLDALAEEQIEPGALAVGDENVVRILTIHASKGLEYPVVFLLGAGNQFNTQGQAAPLHCDVTLGCGLRFGDYPDRRNIVSARHHVAQNELGRRELEEELRLTYVAATRARERLHVIGHAKPQRWDELRALYVDRAEPPPLIARLSASDRLEWLLAAIAAANLPEAVGGALVRTRPADTVALPNTPEPATASTPIAATRADDAWCDTARRWITTSIDDRLAHRPAVLSVSAAKALARRDVDADTPAELELSPPTVSRPQFARTAETVDGRALGTIVHRFLELADLRGLATVDDVGRQLRQLIGGGRLTEEEAGWVDSADVAWLGQSEIGGLLHERAEHVQRELPFVYALPLDIDNEFTIVRGIIDCVIPTEAGLVLVDYKTDRVRPEQFAERVALYGVQMRLYAQAATAVLGQPVRAATLAFLRMRRLESIELRPVTAAELLRSAGDDDRKLG